MISRSVSILASARAPPSLRPLGRRFLSQETVDWLRAQGFSDAVAAGIVKAFPSAPSVAEVSAMGKEGLAALAQAVQQEEQRFEHASEVQMLVRVPKERRELRLSGREGETLCELAAREPQLAQVLECACRGIAACSTCHVYVDDEFLALLPVPEEAELDMLDLAWEAKENSRLGCQIRLSKSIEGLSVTIPQQANNLYN